MKKRKKKGREGCYKPSLDPRNPRKVIRGTARERQRLESVRIEDRDDDIRADTVRIVDTITLLHRRRQIDDRQLRAAEAYRDAASLCEGRIPCALNRQPGRVSGGAFAPSEVHLSAAQLLAQAGMLLGALDGYIVRLVAVAGFTIDECAARLFGAEDTGRARRSDAEHVGRRLRLALEALAAAWWPDHGPRPRWLPPAVDNPGGQGY